MEKRREGGTEDLIFFIWSLILFVSEIKLLAKDIIMISIDKIKKFNTKFNAKSIGSFDIKNYWDRQS